MTVDAFTRVQRRFPDAGEDAQAYAAELLGAVEAAHDILGSVADSCAPDDHGVRAAFEVLADTLASVEPPAATRPIGTARNGGALLLADALARRCGRNLDGSPRRETRPLEP